MNEYQDWVLVAICVFEPWNTVWLRDQVWNDTMPDKVKEQGVSCYFSGAQ